MDFDKVRKEHIILGIQDFETQGIPIGFGSSSTYNLLYKGKIYPPKVVIVYANFYASDRKIEQYFKGGEGTECFEVLRDRGFDVVKKYNDELYELKNSFLKKWPLDSLKEMSLDQYTSLSKDSFCYWLEHITRDLGSIVGGSSYKFGIYKRSGNSDVKEESNRNTDGEYAWFKKYGANRNEAFETVKDTIIKIAQFADINNLSAIDKIDLGNAYKWKIAFLYSNYTILNTFKVDALRVIASYLNIRYTNKTQNSEFSKAILKTKPIDKDYYQYSKELWQYYQEGKLNVQNDFALWLDKNMPSTYRVYLGSTVETINFKLNEINSFFDDIDLFLVNPKRVNDLMNSIRFLLTKKERAKNIDFDFYDKKKGTGRPKAILGKENYFKFLESKFGGVINTDEKDFIEALKVLDEEDTVSYFQFLDQIKDTLSLKSNDNRFVTGISNQRLNLTVGQRYCWNLYAKKSNGKFGVISAAKINDTTVDYEGGTNDAYYTYSSDHNLALNNKASVIRAISNELERTIKSSFDKFNNTAFEKAMFDSNYRMEVFKKAYIQQRYFLVGSYWKGRDPDQTDRFVKKGIWQNGYDDKFLDEVKSVEVGDHIAVKAAFTREKIKSVMLIKARGVVLENANDGKNLKINWEEDFKPFEVDFSGGYWSTIKEVTNKEHINSIWVDEVAINMNKPTNKVIPINEIFYGPPGTGKTYTLQKEYFKKYTVNETSLTRQQFLDQMVSDLTWWQVLSMAVLDLGKVQANEILNHEVIQTKAKLSSSTNPRATVWGRLQAHTVAECDNVNVSDRSEPRIFYKDENSNWSLIQKNLEEFYPEAISNLAISKNFIADADKQIRNYEFVTFHQSFSYEDFVEGIKPVMEDGERDLGYEIQDGVFKKLCQRAKVDPDNNYAIFIDEINRGNVSAIFGELITLIEKDKRAGGINELEVQLPYSKDKFSVPANLHIYGTMNTADRSVEALDTALRRRFTFKELMPNPSLLSDIQFDGFTLQEVLKTINERIEVLVDRDHTIGHSYFLSIDSGDTEALFTVFQNKIIPLLQEYFYHDYEKMALILGAGFIKQKKNNEVKFASFGNLDIPPIDTQLVLKDTIDNIEEAVLILLNKSRN